MQQLSPQDAQFLYTETEHNLTHVTGISIFDPSTVPGGRTVRFTEIIEHMRERLAYNPQFFRRLLRLPLELDYPYWVEDEFFDLEYHISHGRLPAPGDWRQFCIHMARYHSRPLDMSRPPWEMYVVEGLDNCEGFAPGCYAVVTKVHHAAVDGASMMRFFATLADADPQGTPLVPLEMPATPSGEAPDMQHLLRRAIGNNLRSPLRMAETLMRAAPGIYRAAQDSVRQRREDKPKHPVPHTRFNVDLSPHKMFDARIFPLDDLKAIRALHVGVTINDVVLAICAGALRRYLEHHNELPEESLIAWVPINARPKGVDGGDAPGNNITAMTAPIFTDEPDAAKRLLRIHRATRASKEARSGMSARLMTDVSQHVPAATQVLASRLLLRSGVAARFCNLFVSNVPGPQVPTYMNGAKMVGSLGLAPLADGMGLFIATPSYDGKMTFNVISTREVLPDIEFFMHCLEDSLAELKALAADAAEAPERSAPRKKAKSGAKTKTRTKTRTRTRAKAGSKAKASTKVGTGSKANARPKAKAGPAARGAKATGGAKVRPKRSPG
jgi:WS/DGAT/MGAT family acyltransferase